MSKVTGSTRAGGAPLCPVDPSHGRLAQWMSGTVARPDVRWYCSHQAHDREPRTPKFFTNKEADGSYEQTEADMTSVYEEAARGIVAGSTTLDAATQSIARTSKRASSIVREALTVMLETVQEKSTKIDTIRTQNKNRRQPPPPPPGGVHRLEQVPGERWAAVIAAAGLTNKQAAEATGDGWPETVGGEVVFHPMGKSSTYIYILTHQGASAELFGKFEKAIKSYAKRHKIKAPKVTS